MLHPIWLGSHARQNLAPGVPPVSTRSVRHPRPQQARGRSPVTHVPTLHGAPARNGRRTAAPNTGRMAAHDPATQDGTDEVCSPTSASDSVPAPPVGRWCPPTPAHRASTRKARHQHESRRGSQSFPSVTAAGEDDQSTVAIHDIDERSGRRHTGAPVFRRDVVGHRRTACGSAPSAAPKHLRHVRADAELFWPLGRGGGDAPMPSRESCWA